MSALDRTRQLIALTASDSPNEARNAALQACKLIRQHGFEVVEKRADVRGAPFDAWDAAAGTTAAPGAWWDMVYGSPFAGVNRGPAGPHWSEHPGQSQAARNAQEELADMLRRAAAEAGAAASTKKPRGSEPEGKGRWSDNEQQPSRRRQALSALWRANRAPGIHGAEWVLVPP